MLTQSRFEAVRECAIPLLDGVAGDYDALLSDVDGARVVVLGIGWRGSHELFQARVELTKRLIGDIGFSSLSLDEPSEVVQAIEAYVSGRTRINPVGGIAGPVAAMDWTWHNAEMLEFLFWLRGINDLFESDRHKVAVRSLDGQLHERNVIWADWHSLSPGNDGVGRLARQRLGRQAVLVGFTTASGTTLTDNLGEPLLQSIVPSGSPESVETMLHEVHQPWFMLRLRDAPDRLTSAFRGTPAEHLDAIVHFERSRALDALLM